MLQPERKGEQEEAREVNPAPEIKVIYGLTNGVNAFSSTSLAYGIAPIVAIRAMVIIDRFRVLR